MFNNYSNLDSTLAIFSANLYLFNDFFFINFLNVKNIIFLESKDTFNIFFNNSFNNLAFWYETQNNSNALFLYSILLDYYNIINTQFTNYFCLNQYLEHKDIFINFYLNNFYTNNFTYKILSANFFKYSIFSHSSFFLIAILFLFIYLFFSFIYLFLNNAINVTFKNEKIYDEYNNIVNYLVESEKELGSLDDMFVGVSILICIYGWFFFGTVFFNFFSAQTFTYVYIGFPLFLFTVLGMPSNMIWNYGILYPIYLRGSSNTTLFFLEFLYDLLATGIMYIRLFVQNVRFVLMFFAFFECYEFFMNITFVTKNYYFSGTLYTYTEIFYNFITNTINFVIFYVYNVCHLIYTIISHFFAYLILVFWFFSFLYTTFFQEKLEFFFKKK